MDSKYIFDEVVKRVKRCCEGGCKVGDCEECVLSRTADVESKKPIDICDLVWEWQKDNSRFDSEEE